MTEGPLLGLDDAHVWFDGPAGRVAAVRGVSFRLLPGQALGLVGESGSGKSTTAMAALGLAPLRRGRRWMAGEDTTGWSARQLRPLRRHVQPVLQDARAAFNPRRRVASSIAEPLVVHGGHDPAVHARAVAALLEEVGLTAAMAERRPDGLSGGQLQRASIARALACEPAALVLDEPISALDVSVAAQVLNLLRDLRQRRGLAYLFIAHDLHAVAHVCDHVAVMYLGMVVEEGPAASVLDHPVHPYTRALVASAPSLASIGAAAAGAADRLALQGDPASPLRPPRGCALHPRCPVATAQCAAETPDLRAIRGDRKVACWRPEHDGPGGELMPGR